MNKSLLITALLFISSFGFSQMDKGELEKQVVLKDSLKYGQEHSYSMLLNKNKIVHLELNQNGIDIVISVYDPNGALVGRFDTPNGSQGVENVVFNTALQGTYYLYVTPFANQSSGNYSIECKSIETVAKTLDGFVDQLMFLYDIKDPGAAISVVDEGELVYSGGFGSANLEYDIPITENSVFHIASISKQVTAFSVLLLEEKGLLSMDDDVRKYIPEIPIFETPITLRHLANHTSGLRDQWNLLVMAGWDMEDVITTNHVLKLVARQQELNFKPGEEILYSNTGYTLLAEVVARVSGKSFSEFTQDEIFTPLEMSSTQFYDDHQKIVKNRVYSYYYNNREGKYKKSKLNYSVPGATSLFTTVDDLAKWAINFEDIKVGSAAIFEKMNTSEVLPNGDLTNYSMGQAIGEYKGLKNFSHGGADAGYRTVISRFPEQQFSVIVFTNESSANPRQIADLITNMYLRKEFPKNQNQEMDPHQEHSEPADLEELNLEKLIGSYKLSPDVTVDIFEENGVLYGKATGQQRVEMVAVSEYKFVMPSIDASARFLPNAEGVVNSVELEIGGEVAVGKKIEDLYLTDAPLEEFEGYYYSEELETGYTLTKSEPFLIVSHSRVPSFFISEAGKDTFDSNNWAFETVEFERDENGAVTGFRVSNGRVKKLLFQKQ